MKCPRLEEAGRHMEKAKEWLGEKLIQLASPVPGWLWYLLFGTLALLALAVLGAALYRLLQGDELKTKWFTLRPSRSVAKLEIELEATRHTASGALATLKSEFDTTYHVSSQRRVLLETTRGVVIDLAAFIAGEVTVQPEQFLAELQRFSLKAMLCVLRDDVQNPLRLGLFMPDPADPGSLMLADSCSNGFTAVELQNKRLSMQQSAAGFVFLTGKEYVNPHLSRNVDHVFQPRPDGAYPYESLICMPVQLGKVIRAVLSVDWQNPTIISQEEVRYIRHTAMLVGLAIAVVESRGAAFAEVASAPDPYIERPPGGAKVGQTKKASRPSVRRRK